MKDSTSSRPSEPPNWAAKCWQREGYRSGLIVMSTFYVESAQEENQMFRDIAFDAATLEEHDSYCVPVICNAGSIIVNTEEMKANNLPTPKSIKDLADPVYKGHLSVTDIPVLLYRVAAGTGSDFRIR